MILEQPDDLPRWYAIHTNPKQEGRADSNLRAWGVQTFHPKLKEGRRNQFTGVMSYVSISMFPRYIFARFDAGKLLHHVWYTRGVESVVSLGENPAVIDDEIISLLQSQLDENGFVKLEDELKSGDKIVITDGPLKNFAGVFARDMNQSERVLVLLNAVTYQSHVTVSRSDVRKVA